MKIRLRLDTDESKERWRLIKEASKEINEWDELKKSEAYRRSSDRESLHLREAEMFRSAEKHG